MGKDDGKEDSEILKTKINFLCKDFIAFEEENKKKRRKVVLFFTLMK